MYYFFLKYICINIYNWFPHLFISDLLFPSSVISYLMIPGAALSSHYGYSGKKVRHPLTSFKISIIFFCLFNLLCLLGDTSCH